MYTRSYRNGTRWPSSDKAVVFKHMEVVHMNKILLIGLVRKLSEYFTGHIEFAVVDLVMVDVLWTHGPRNGQRTDIVLMNFRPKNQMLS